MMRMSMMVGSASRAPDSGKQVASVSQAVAFQCHSKRLFVFDRETKQPPSRRADPRNNDEDMLQG